MRGGAMGIGELRRLLLGCLCCLMILQLAYMFSSVLMNQLVLICKNLHSVLINLLTNKLFALVLIAMVTTTVTFPPIESLKLITLELWRYSDV